jgi:uncharacterized membrane protein
VLAEPIAVGSVLRTSAPRLVRDAIGPIASFYVGWKLVGLLFGIALATGFGLVMYRHERRRGRPALVVRVALGLVLLQAIVGVVSGNAKVYLGQEVVVDTLLGAMALGSVFVGRPLANAFGREVYSFPDEVRDSATYIETFRRITIAWGICFLVRAAVRLLAILTLSVDGYVLVAALTGAPVLVAMLAWSVIHTARVFRRSEEWGAELVAAETRAAETASTLSP